MATALWWSNFLNEQGRDSEEEAAFLGFLTTNNISPETGDLDGAYRDFLAFMAASHARASADPGPSRAELVAAAAVAALEPTVPASRTSNPQVQKPLSAATRPPEFRKEEEPSTPEPKTPESSPPGTEPAARGRRSE